MNADKPVLVVPVENQVRELDAKLLLACAAVERGFDVVFGSRTFVQFVVSRVPRGVFLAKSLRGISARMFRLLHGLGHDIVAWDEESLVRFSSPEYYEFRYTPETFAAVDRLFAWGPDDAELFESYRGYTGIPIHVTGNPRMDMLRPELRGYFDEEVSALRRRFGNFILVNTNFPFVNPFVPGLALLQPNSNGVGVHVGRTGRGMSLEFALGYAHHIETICKHFQALIPRLGEWFPDHTVIVRPHPSENHETWQRLVAHQPNVQVLHEGNVVPWLLASRALLHNGCTTAVEAAVLDHPALSYMPVTSECYDYPLPNALSHQATTVEAVREKLTAMLDGTLGPLQGPERDRLLDRHVASNRGPLAVDRVLDALEQAGYAKGPKDRPPLRTYLAAWMGTNMRTLGKRINWYRRGHRNSAAYHEHRFPEIGTADIEARIRRLQQLLGRFDDVVVERRSRFVFRLSPRTSGRADRASRRHASGAA